MTQAQTFGANIVHVAFAFLWWHRKCCHPVAHQHVGVTTFHCHLRSQVSFISASFLCFNLIYLWRHWLRWELNPPVLFLIAGSAVEVLRFYRGHSVRLLSCRGCSDGPSVLLRYCCHKTSHHHMRHHQRKCFAFARCSGYTLIEGCGCMNIGATTYHFVLVHEYGWAKLTVWLPTVTFLPGRRASGLLPIRWLILYHHSAVATCRFVALQST